MADHRGLLKTILSFNDARDDDHGEDTSPLSQRSSSETAALSTITHSSSSFSEHTRHETTHSHHSHHSEESSEIFLSQISQLITSFIAEATEQIISTSTLSSSTVMTSLSSTSKASSTSGLDRSTVSSPAMPLYVASESAWGKMTTTTMTTSMTEDLGSSETVIVRTTTITMPVPSLTETIASSSSSHVNLPGTLAPTLGLLALLAVASGAIVWRRRKRLRQVQRVSRGIEGGFNKSNARYDGERLSLMEETGHMPPLTGTKIVPNPFESRTDLSGQYGTRNLDYEEPNSGRAVSDSIGLLSENANSHRQPTPATMAHEDERNLQTSYADDESISDISSITVPFFEHIKAARRAGIHPSSAGRSLQQESQSPTEEDNLLNSHSPDDV